MLITYLLDGLLNILQLPFVLNNPLVCLLKTQVLQVLFHITESEFPKKFHQTLDF